MGTDIFNAALPLDEQHLFEAVSSTIILSGPVIGQINQQNLNEQTHAQDLQALMMVLGTLEGANPYVQAGDALANCSGANCVRAFGIAALAVATDGESGAVPLGFKSAEQFGQACSELCSVLSEAGISDATVGVRGSSVTGSNFETGAPFGESSDIDFFVVSGELTDGLRTNSYGMVGPWAVEANYPGIAAWSDNWSGILGRDVSVAGFANMPPGPVILGKP